MGSKLLTSLSIWFIKAGYLLKLPLFVQTGNEQVILVRNLKEQLWFQGRPSRGLPRSPWIDEPNEVDPMPTGQGSSLIFFLYRRLDIWWWQGFLSTNATKKTLKFLGLCYLRFFKWHLVLLYFIILQGNNHIVTYFTEKLTIFLWYVFDNLLSILTQWMNIQQKCPFYQRSFPVILKHSTTI